MPEDEPLSERVQEPIKSHPDDTHPDQAESTPPVRDPEPQKSQTIVFDSYAATITRKETHKSGLWEIDFSLDKELHFKPGQYVSVYVENLKKPAPFSIASSPVDTKNVVLGIEVVGEVTTTITALDPGTVVTLKGPFGKFVIGDHERKVCLLAGGIGITPFMSMLRWVRDTHPDKHVVLFYSCKAEDQFMWLDELEEMQRTNENIKIVLTITKDLPEGWKHKSGRISQEMIREEIPDYDEYVYFTCGPKGLIEAMFTLLEGMGIPKENIRREAWH